MRRLAIAATLLGVAASLRHTSEPAPRPPEVLRVVVDGSPSCRGIAVSQRHVLTARHCVQRRGTSEVLSPSRIRIEGPLGRVRATVTSVAVRASELEHLGQLAGTDLALLGVRDARFTPLGPSQLLGATAPELPRTLYLATGETTRAALVESAGPRELITRAVTCEGESGAPLIDARGSAVGIASWRTPGPCGQGRSVFTRVDAHRAWIMEAIRY